MVKRTFKKYIKEAYTSAARKGFYTCSTCSAIEADTCPICHGTGIYRDKKSLYMHIIKECAEASTAEERSKKKVDLAFKHALFLIHPDDVFKMNIDYEKDIKGTPEEELADIAIIIFSLCGYLKLDLDEKKLHERPYEDITPENREMLIDSCLFDISSDVCSSYYFRFDRSNHLISALSTLFSLATALGIPLEAHIVLKMRYNTTRNMLHKGEH